MTGKVKISFLVLVWSIVAIQMYVNYRQNGSETVTAFSVVEDSISDETIKGCGYFEKVELSEATKKKMLENLAFKLGITEGYTFSGGTGDSYDKTTLKKMGKHATTTLQIISMYGDDGDNVTEDEGVNDRTAEQYIVMEINTSAGSKEAYSLYSKMKKVYEEIGVDAQVSLEIDASKRGNYIADGRNQIFNEILSLVKAKKVDEIMENGICTIYGYTKNESNHLTLNGKKVNIQAVMSYDEDKDTTYIKIGMPIVNSSY